MRDVKRDGFSPGCTGWVSQCVQDYWDGAAGISDQLPAEQCDRCGASLDAARAAETTCFRPDGVAFLCAACAKADEPHIIPRS